MFEYAFLNSARSPFKLIKSWDTSRDPLVISQSRSEQGSRLGIEIVNRLSCSAVNMPSSARQEVDRQKLRGWPHPLLAILDRIGG